MIYDRIIAVINASQGKWMTLQDIQQEISNTYNQWVSVDFLLLDVTDAYLHQRIAVQPGDVLMVGQAGGEWMSSGMVHWTNM